MKSEYIKYDAVKELINADFSENETIGYDIGNGERFEIVANCWDEENNLWWFGCDEYDYVYSLDELMDSNLVELI